jgi:hypothetical protein
LADALAILVESASKIMPSGNGVVSRMRIDRVDGRPCNFRREWLRRIVDPMTGATIYRPCDPPVGSPDFEQHAIDSALRGITSIEVEKFLADNPQLDPRIIQAVALASKKKGRW